jgi:hypothetical protein
MHTSIGRITPKLRGVVASAIVSSYGYLLFLVWAVPQSVLFMEFGEESPSLVWTAIVPMVILPFGFQLLPRRLYDLQNFEHDGRFYRRLGVRRICFFAGMGEGIQKLARVIDPQWKNPLGKLSPLERINWTRGAEGIHWGFLIGSAPLIALTFYLGHTTFGIVFCLINVLFNIYPIMLQRYTRAKLLRIDRARASRSPVNGLT